MVEQHNRPPAGQKDRQDISEFFAGPVLTYHFAEFAGQPGWYARWTDELMSFNWKESGSDVAQIPVGAALGRVLAH